MALISSKDLDRYIAERMGVDEHMFNFAYETGKYRYSSDLDKALFLINEMRGRGLMVTLTFCAFTSARVVVRGREGVYCTPEYDSPSLAVCDAFLEVVEGKTKLGSDYYGSREDEA